MSGAVSTNSDERSTIRRIYLWSFLLRFGGGVLAWWLTTAGVVSLAEDARLYELRGAAVAQDWLAGRQSLWLEEAIQGGSEAWLIVALIAVFYVVTGGLRALPVLIAFYSAITAATPVLTFRLARKLGADVRPATLAAWIVALSPGFAFWSGALYKEGIILLALNGAVLCTLHLQERFRAGAFLGLAVSLLALFGLRFYVATTITIIILLTLALGRTASKRPGASMLVFARQVIVIAAVAGTLWGLGVPQRVLPLIPATPERMFRAINFSRMDLASSESAYLPDHLVSDPATAMRFLPIGVAYFLAVPLPWQVGSLRQNLALPETAIWVLLLYPLACLGIGRPLRVNPRGTFVIIAFTIAMSAFYGLFIGNIGTAYRLRMQIWLFVAIFVAIGYDRLRSRSARNREPHRIQIVNIPGSTVPATVLDQ